MGSHGQRVLSTTTLRVGTPAFMCAEPSQLPGPGERDPQGVLRPLASRDWYALGCCLMLMLLGERGSRIARAPRGGVLLPPPSGDIHAALREHARHLGDDCQALT